MNTHIDRMKQEVADLDARLEKLTNFVEGEMLNINPLQRNLLFIQQASMLAYLRTLKLRLVQLGEVHHVTIETVANVLYTRYCEAVGGKAFNGDPLPDWTTFAADPAKSKQANGWREVALVSVQMSYGGQGQ